MKRNIFVLATMLVVFLAVFALLAVRPTPTVRAQAQAQAQACSNAVLNGNLGLWGPGHKGNNGWDFSMLAGFNGLGSFSGSQVNAVHRGAAVPGSGGSFLGGTYSVNADCTFTAKSTDLEAFGNLPVILNGIAVRGGNEVVGTWYSGDGQSGTFHAEAVISY